MPYAGGETPEVGDYVENEYKQPGTVTRTHAAHDGQEYINVKWDDGGVSLLSASAAQFTLLFRRNS
jgi:hypothetical protein